MPEHFSVLDYFYDARRGQWWAVDPHNHTTWRVLDHRPEGRKAGLFYDDRTDMWLLRDGPQTAKVSEPARFGHDPYEYVRRPGPTPETVQALDMAQYEYVEPPRPWKARCSRSATFAVVAEHTAKPGWFDKEDEDA